MKTILKNTGLKKSDVKKTKLSKKKKFARTLLTMLLTTTTGDISGDRQIATDSSKNTSFFF